MGRWRRILVERGKRSLELKWDNYICFLIFRIVFVDVVLR